MAREARLAGAAPQTRDRVEILDLLRAVAILAVLFFHYSFRGAAADGFTDISLPALAPYAKYGFLGVQLFFIISGFVIAYSAEQRTAVEFGIARVARIYPGFLVCMTLTFILTLVFGAPRFEATFGQWLANYAIVAPALKQPFMDGAYWSIVYEITFYAWVAVLLQIGWFRRHIDVVIIAWLALAVLDRELHWTALQRIFLTDQSGFFAAGLSIYQIYRGRRDAVIMLLLALSTVTAIGQSLQAVAWNRGHYHVPYDDRVVVGLSLMTIVAVGLALRVRRLPVPSSIVVGIGGVTYPLYLLHQNIGFIVFNRLAGTMSPWLIVIATATAVVLLAWVVWRYVERPGQRLLKRLLSHLTSRLGDAVALERLMPWRRS
jgi:peptidoglycan/LPS O-acetylase OafA/YrhL